MRNAILALPDQLRDVLLAVDVAGLSYREAGRALRIREATVTGRLHRARKVVVRDLESDSVEAAGATGERRTGGAQSAAGGDVQ